MANLNIKCKAEWSRRSEINKDLKEGTYRKEPRNNESPGGAFLNNF